MFFAATEQIPLDEAVIEQAVALRQQKNVKLADAIIAATAIIHHLPLATQNVRDFAWINSLPILNPYGR